ncbi:CHASE2 domain-containing protein [Alcaligenaceae bacterium 429]|uniref:CHASE2 domain-containing protein n=1 Tax=Paenalcaligenes sp. Me52 TaxID=3392038 RepID=UPI00109217E7|nr:CHASE2 domain-containing protein [Alcaligenaceae bacterium 429]
MRKTALPLRPPSGSSSLGRQVLLEWRIMTFFLILLTILLIQFKDVLKLSQVDSTFYDFYMKLALPVSEPDPDIALVVIDEGSLQQMGYWPWRRAEHANLLENLSQAKAVGFDILFQDYNPAYPQDDLTFANAIKNHGRTVLPSIVRPDSTPATVDKPVSPLAESAAELGFINIYPDPDGAVRRISLYTTDGEQTFSHIIPAMLKAGGEEQIADALLAAKPTEYMINFSGPPDHYQTYPYSAVANGLIPAEEFKDRYVLVGAWSSGLGDYYPTPRSWVDRTSMAGVEILANALSNARDDNWIKPLPTWLVIVLNIIPIYLVCLILIRFSPRKAFLTTTALWLILVGLDWALLQFLNFWLPISSSLVVMMLAYPAWHWRSQETVLRHINHELSVLSAQDSALRLALEAKAPTETLPARLSFLHRGIELLREAQQRREQTLRFISHDMRAPQNSILALVSLQRSGQEALDEKQLLGKIESYASNTLELVNNFMDLARAEAMEIEFHDVNLGDVLADVYDDAWSRAKAKHIEIAFDTTEEQLYVYGNATMLRRTFNNLVDNAIKYSSPNTTVRCTLTQEDNYAVASIKDQGWGIPDHLQPTIFQAFNRAHSTAEDAPVGSGIGLAFVQTVIQRHRGYITLESEEGKGSTFTVKLPISEEAE